MRPAATTLAWEPSPTAVTDAQKAAAVTACAAGLPPAGGTAGGNVIPVPATEASGLPVVGGDSTTTVTRESGVGSGTSTAGGTQVTVGGDGQSAQWLPPMPTALPALVGLELHGTGGVAIFADGKVTAFCLLVKDGDTLTMGGLLFPDLGGGVAAGVGTVGAAAGQGGSSSMVATGANGFNVSAMSTTFGGQTVGIIAGQVPKGTATVKIVGGSADGATATVDHGFFGLWAPGSLQGQDAKVVALGADGKQLAEQSLARPDGGQVVTGTAAP